METAADQNETTPLPEPTPPRPRKPLTLFKKLVIIIFCVVSSFGLYDLIFPSQPATAPTTIHQPSPTQAPKKIEWKTYTNTKYHYAIGYPADWTYREYPDTQTGAGFRLANKPNDLCCETITIDYTPKMGAVADLPFEKYVSVAGQAIQGYGDIQSSQKVTTATGIVGYTTTWHVQSLQGEQTISAPITFFPAKEDTAGIIMVSVVNPKDSVQMDTYTAMLKTFSYK